MHSIGRYTHFLGLGHGLPPHFLTFVEGVHLGPFFVFTQTPLHLTFAQVMAPDTFKLIKII